MATKSKKKTTKSSAASTTKKKTTKREPINRQLAAWILFAVGVLVAAISFIPGQSVWRALHDGLFGLLGIPGYLVGPFFIYVAVIIALEKTARSVRASVWQAIVMLVLIAAAITIYTSSIRLEDGFGQSLVLSYQLGIKLAGGGAVSAFLAYPMLSLFGDVGAGIIIGVLIFVFIMIFAGKSLIDFFASFKKPVEGINKAYTEMQEKAREHAEVKAEVKAEQKAARRDLKIDIDLGPDPEPELLEQHKEKVETPVFHSIVVPDPAPAPEPGPQTIIVPPVTSAVEAEPEPAPQSQPAEHESMLWGATLDDLDGEMLAEAAPAVSQAEPVLTPDTQAEVDETLDAALFDMDAPPPGDDDAPPAPDELVAVHPPLSSDMDSVKPDELEDGESEGTGYYEYPPISLLASAPKSNAEEPAENLRATADRLVETLESFGVKTKVVDYTRGPTVTRYELQPQAGVKISKITGLADDIALNLAAGGVRIEAPIPNKPAVGIEVPNKHVSVVSLREIIDSREFENASSRLTFALGRDIAGNVALADIAKMPHTLIAGATGSGKSVCINSLIVSLLYKASPAEVKLMMIDPKVVELGVYNGIPHLLAPVVTDPRKAGGALVTMVNEMMRRYKQFADAGVRDIFGYNEHALLDPELEKLPQIVIIIDELADLMMVAPREIEDSICRLAQMARAAGMHLVIATQRPSVDVITGVIKANIPSRIAFAVSSMVDSRTILDTGGAEKLLGRGDMLFYPVGASKPMRMQGSFVTEKEIEKVVEYIKKYEGAQYDEDLIEQIEKNAIQEKGAQSGGPQGGGGDDVDDMLQPAIECVVEAGIASTSLLQRRLKLGYARAARLIDEMEQRGIVGPFQGSKPREVLLTRDRMLEMNMHNPD